MKQDFFFKIGPVFVGFFMFVLCFGGLNVSAVEEDTEAFDDAFDPVLGQTDTPSVSAVQEVAAKLQGIGMGAEKSFAIINGEVYKLGEQKKGIRVTQIRKKEVDIIVNGVPRHLRMNVVATKPGEEIPEETGEGISEINTAEEDMSFDDEPESAIQTREITNPNNN